MKRRWLYFFLAAALLIAACLCARYILLRLDDTPSLPEQAGILAALLDQEQAIRRRTALDIQKHAPSRVEFNTLDVEY